MVYSFPNKNIFLDLLKKTLILGCEAIDNPVEVNVK
jgi:hypothetical protein